MESELSLLNVICLLNVLYILVKSHENIIKGFKVMVLTRFYKFCRLGVIVRVVILVPHTPTQYPLQPDKVS